MTAVEQCPELRIVDADEYPPVRCAYVAGHGGEHRFPVHGEDLSPEIRLRAALDRGLEALRAERARTERLVGLLRDVRAQWQDGCDWYRFLDRIDAELAKGGE